MTRLRNQASVTASLACLAMLTAPANAIVLTDDDFSAGYNDAPIQFQQPLGAGNGIWLGQGGTVVDTASEAVQGRGGGFLRNAWSLGATGATLQTDDGNGVEVGADFLEGDVIKVSSEFQFTLATAGNTSIYSFGVTDCFQACGGVDAVSGNPVNAFEASPRAGIETGWNNFGAGGYKVFTNYVRDSNIGTDNPFGIILSGPDIGIINGKDGDDAPTGAELDLVSDTLRIEYVAEYTDATTQTWTATDLIITNLDTTEVLSDAKINKPAALETFVWNSTGVEDDFTDAIERGLARHTTAPGSDMFFAATWTPAGNADQETNVSAVRFEYLRNLPPLLGDYNGDFVVDAADYTVWRDSLGQVGAGLPADGTGDDLSGVPDGDVDGFDYDFWVQQFGTVSTSSAVGVPEPTTLGLLAAATLWIGVRTRG